ncbi:hypothetical protein O3G_MSEX011097, partial [Manduca sexta]
MVSSSWCSTYGARRTREASSATMNLSSIRTKIQLSPMLCSTSSVLVFLCLR